MDDYQLLVDLHKDGYRQGPGGDAETELALRLAGIDREAPLRVADLGCGTGASALVLARLLNAKVTAVDVFEAFLEVLEERAEKRGVADRIETLAASMERLPFEEASYDVIWSEGAIYNIGFERGVADWRRYLKEGGHLVVSELTWTSGSRPSELQQYWEGAYPEIGTASSKIDVLERHGYAPVGYFALPEHCWLDNYYRPLQDRFEALLQRHGHSGDARAIVEADQREIEMYERYRAYYSYGFYVARKVSL